MVPSPHDGGAGRRPVSRVAVAEALTAVAPSDIKVRTASGAAAVGFFLKHP